MDAEEILKGLTLVEKIKLLSGEGYWHTARIKDIPVLRMSDGPTGLRVEADESKNMDSLKATCFPTASALASSFDKSLVYLVGEALSEECCHFKVHILLAPGINIKRNPLCGRNFEYYSEDPYLTGKLASRMVQGIQSKGTGACLKHFAVNSREKNRMLSSSEVDERALREIYLKAFETVVKEAKPYSVMCAYNAINSVKCSENTYLLNDILRKEWGYGGAVISDWGAVTDPVAAAKGGVDLSMPGINEYASPQLEKAVENGILSEETIDERALNVLKLIDRAYDDFEYRADFDAHDALAVKAAESCAVLLKNEGGVLPIKTKAVTVIGSMAGEFRIQGGGSARVNPFYTLNLVEAFERDGYEVKFLKGYEGGKNGESLILESLENTADNETVVVAIGLYDSGESEGFDREDMRIPLEQTELLRRLKESGRKVAAVLNCGGAVETDFSEYTDALVYMPLSGQGGARALQNILTGAVNPSGKLAETFIKNYSDHATADRYLSEEYINRYAESIYVGYRYYDKAGITPAFAFGHGLSYTTFTYSNLVLQERKEGGYSLTVTVKNTGEADGAEVVQFYVSPRFDGYIEKKRLAAFEKVFIKAGQSISLSAQIDEAAFEAFTDGGFKTVGGGYDILCGSSSLDIRLSCALEVKGEKLADLMVPQFYVDCKNKPSDGDFDKLRGFVPEDREKQTKGNFTLKSTIFDIKKTFIGKILLSQVKKQAVKMSGQTEGEVYRMFYEGSLKTPLISLAAMSRGMISAAMAEGFVHMANGKFFKGIKRILSKNKKS